MRYTITDETGGYRQFSVWWTHFSAKTIRELVLDSGLAQPALYGSVWGSTFSDDGEWICVIAGRA
jgi:hypothetical protein